jgi:hypothetical protein
MNKSGLGGRAGRQAGWVKMLMKRESPRRSNFT